jgi:DNA replication and repair protein RecF
MLSIAKSPRANVERDLIAKSALMNLNNGGSYSKISSTVSTGKAKERLEIHYRSLPWENDDGFKTQKFIQINGSPKRSSDLVGIQNAVLFTVDDLDLVYGRPSKRRKYLDILISQVNKDYLKSLQKYHSSLIQRNHLLKSIRDGLSSSDQLSFWDDSISSTGSKIMSLRLETIRILSEKSVPIHMKISGIDENMEFQYKPSIEVVEQSAPRTIESSIKMKLEISRPKDIAQGSTLNGPHRDDMKIIIDNQDANRYASRGQARTSILALKLAEAAFLNDRRKSQPILLFDDLLSELDTTRRNHIIDYTGEYEQCIITTAEVDTIPKDLAEQSNLLSVSYGKIFPFPNN